MISEELAKYKKLISNGDIEVRIVSDSMTPFIKVGQSVKITKIERELQPFDIVVFLGSGKRMICHFVLKVFEEHIITTNSLKLSNVDAPILKENILGIAQEIKLPLFFRLKTIIFFLFFNR